MHQNIAIKIILVKVNEINFKEIKLMKTKKSKCVKLNKKPKKKKKEKVFTYSMCFEDYLSSDEESSSSSCYSY